MSNDLQNHSSREIHTEEFQLMPCGDKLGSDECPTSQENSFHKKKLRLMMISCENKAPYGPASNVAKMFLSLFGKAFQLSWKSEKKCNVMVSIAVYDAKQEDYPQSEEEWNCYDGILIPGSLSSAHGEESWITILKQVIQNDIHAKERKTLAVCFGHQVFAHSFQIGKESAQNNTHGGLAVACPSGFQIGLRSFNITSTGNDIIPLEGSSLSMLYTHGDMVESLPENTLSLGGSDIVPIQAACYYSSAKSTTPYAFTFQGHPEFSTDLGLVTFRSILNNFKRKETLSSQILERAGEDAKESFADFENDSVKSIEAVSKILGWI